MPSDEYVVWLNDDGSEALGFAPLKAGHGWARYFQPARDWPVVLIRFGYPPPRLGADAGRQPIRVRSWTAYVETGEEATILARELPFGRFETAVNQAQHYAALAPAMSSERIGKAPPAGGLWRTELPLISWEKPALKLDVPTDGGRKPDTFYRAVGDAFSWLASTSKRPAEELAEINDVAVTTVHRWVREARSRGALPPAIGRGTRRRSSDE